ncbi:hypothetical protein AB0L57_14885 [Nocardia sp. NPDC052254]|uniref:hypothetical protein n=1 Tax=Nocardia sp. NPDC052254 TaxID=3155681 RepID=UPI00342C7DA5
MKPEEKPYADAARGFGDLIERVSVLHNSSRWESTQRDLTALLGEPSFSDGKAWAVFDRLNLGDEAESAEWCLLARVTDLDRMRARAAELNWAAAASTVGGHEIRMVLTAPSGLVVVAYTPVRG